MNLPSRFRIDLPRWQGLWGILVLWVWTMLGSAEAGETKTYLTTDGRVLKGVAVREDTGSLTIQVTSDSRGEVPAGERILVFRRDLKEVR